MIVIYCFCYCYSTGHFYFLKEEEKVSQLEKALSNKINDIKELEKSLLQLEDKKQREIICLKIEVSLLLNIILAMLFRITQMH